MQLSLTVDAHGSLISSDVLLWLLLMYVILLVFAAAAAAVVVVLCEIVLRRVEVDVVAHTM